MPKLPGKEPTRKTYSVDDAVISHWPYNLFLARTNSRHVCRIERCGKAFNAWDSPSGAVAMTRTERQRTFYAGSGDPEVFDVCGECATKIYDTPL